MVWFRSLRVFRTIASPKNATTFKGEIFRSVKKLPDKVRSFQGTKNQIIVGNAQAYKFETLKIYRNYENRFCTSFKGSKRSTIVILPSDNLNQDENYWIIDKSVLAEFGLNLSSENSATELLAALILYWSAGNLDSERIKFIFYRYIKFQEDSQWFEQSSYLIDLLAPLPNKKFPDPQSFLI